jgi:two-component system, cell cycle sensor histidine kinase and response regulator CckA
MTIALAVLFVEDSEDDVLLLSRELRKAGYALEGARTDTPGGLQHHLQQRSWDLILSDYVMPSFSGLEALKITRELRPDLPFILISGTVGEELAVESIKAGADDYLMKHNLLRLIPAVKRAVQDAANRRAVRQAEAELRSSQHLVQMVCEHVSDVVILYECTGDECRMVLMNQFGQELVQELFPQLSFEAMYRRTPEELESQIPISTSETLAASHARQQAIHTRRSTVIERQYSTTQHRTISIEYTYVPVLGPNDVVTHLLATGRDISSRKAAEERERELQAQLMQSQKLEALGTLAGGIAHDFNNLLAGIIGFAELTVHSTSLPESHGYASEIMQAGQRARDLVRQILTFSRRQNAARTTVELTELLQEVISLIRATLPSNVAARLEGLGEKISIEADAVQIHQVFMNLCVNAIQAMPDGGTLTLRMTKLVEPPNDLSGLAKADHYLAIDLIDTGTGMPPEVTRRIFEPFFTTKPLGQGTGLGLAVVHGIIRDHGGVITVKSEPRRGTCFTIVLPRLSATGVQAAEAQAIMRGSGEQILCVDDESTVSQVLVGMLRSLGYRVTSVTDPFQALTLFQSAPDAFAVVVTDLVMKGLNGEELIRAMRAKRDDLPIVVMSGNEVPTLSASDWIRTVQLFKPFSLSELGHAINQLLSAVPPPND